MSTFVGISGKAFLGGLFSNLRYRAEVLARLGGVAERSCPLCGYRGRFRGFGHPPRYDAFCPKCTSLERHRLLCLAVQAENVLAPDARVLHFAAEKPLADFLRPRVREYITADLSETYGDLTLDLERTGLPAGCYDTVIANHVLEHVNDKLALAELHRIIRPKGWFISMVPLIEGWEQSYEDDGIVTPRERDLHFGQWDHVRYYGRDYRGRLREAGFSVREYVASGADTVKYGLTRGERVFFSERV